MKRMDIVLVLLIVLLLNACQSAPQELPTPSPGDGAEEATPGQPATGEAYPVLPTPTPTPQDAVYPAPRAPETQAPPTAYPPDMALWILRPWGEQCADPASYAYQNIDEAVTALEDAGVEVLAAEEVNRPVCTACDCPTSEHFRVRIRAQDLVVVQDLGWRQE